MPDVATLASRRSTDQASTSTVQVVPVITDKASRVWLRHSNLTDIWEFPTVLLAGEETPSEAAVGLVESLGLVPGHPEPIGGFRGLDLDTLVLGYRVEVAGTSDLGLFLPLHLAPLNCDPRHVAIAQGALASVEPGEERLDQQTGTQHLLELRAGEDSPTSCPIAITPFLEIVNTRLTEASGPDRAPWLERLAELMIIDGRSHVAGSLLTEAFSLASASGDLATMIRADIRISELDDPAKGEMRAWWWVSELTIPGSNAHLDIPFAYLGAFASRRRRDREAEAYYRRAFLLAEDPARRAWIKSSMASRPLSAARVTA